MKRIEILKKKMPIIFLFIIALVLLMSASVFSAGNKSPAEKKEEKTAKKKEKKPPVLHYEVTVTATRTQKDTFEIPKPVSVINRKKLEEKAPNTVTELLLELPGIDVNGVGTNQSRPVIRGFRGQRILLMEDGIRMNNSRRQQDFGEIPAIIDVSGVDRVEVVRGPASVLYGSDAIGGVVNIITKIPGYKPGTSSVHGNIGYRYSSADKQNKGIANFTGNIGKIGFLLSGNYRKANDYTAPAGDFGDITLDNDITVSDTGVKDGGLNLLMNYNFSKESQLSFKYEYYRAENAGFGFVEPELYNPDPFTARVQIRYPNQKVNKYSVKYENRRLGFALADHLSFTAHHTSNERELEMNVAMKFDIPFLPNAGMNLQTLNFTDIDSLGFRLEFNKGEKGHMVTYGLDYYQDSTFNTDSTITQMTGFGPLPPETDTTPLVPNARYRSIGAFIQDDIALFKRTSLIVGLRYQNVNAKTKATAGLENQPLKNSTDQTFVGAANLIYGVTDHLRLVLCVGRGFRSANLIERFYNGITPEGSGFQERNTDLKAETSLNIDIGFKFRKKNIYLESTFFNNIIYDGIRLVHQDYKTMNMDVWKNENVDKLRMRGIEAQAKVILNFGISLSANYTSIKSKDLNNPETPYVDTYSSKFNLNARYDDPKKRCYFGYDLRINGKQKDIILIKNPLGDHIPGFTVHSITAGITLFPKSNTPQQLAIIIGNLTNTLYSEFSNASFFRPAPKRHVVLTWTAKF